MSQLTQHRMTPPDLDLRERLEPAGGRWLLQAPLVSPGLETFHSKKLDAVMAGPSVAQRADGEAVTHSQVQGTSL